MERILVIKHGALGDIVLATGPFQAIRNYHKDCKITLLTTKAYADILARSNYFDEIWIDSRPKLYNIVAFLKMIGKIRGGNFDRVYDLQTSERTSWYFRLMAKPRPEWVGIAKGASHCHNTPERTKLHTIERQKQQLALAEITNVPHPDLSWLRANIREYKLPERYAIIVAGGAEHRQGKRWAASNYAAVANYLVSKDITPV
ncbi:MAG: glycosyltransferase family 9 protein, partial [Pseudomonadota bacterium]